LEKLKNYLIKYLIIILILDHVLWHIFFTFFYGPVRDFLPVLSDFPAGNFIVILDNIIGSYMFAAILYLDLKKESINNYWIILVVFFSKPIAVLFLLVTLIGTEHGIFNKEV